MDIPINIICKRCGTKNPIRFTKESFCGVNNFMSVVCPKCNRVLVDVKRRCANLNNCYRCGDKIDRVSGLFHSTSMGVLCVSCFSLFQKHYCNAKASRWKKK